MKVSWKTLGAFVDLAGVEPEEAARLLSLRTAPVEGVERLGGLSGVVTAKVLRVEPHPGADRLRLCTVDRGGGATQRVVCGAPNVAEGQAVVFAPVGTTLPNGLALERRKIRGVESEGMICAEDELGLGPDHDGILVLPEGTAPGLPAADVLGVSDAVLELDNTGITNRPDLWGGEGVARELAAVLGRPLRRLVVARADEALARATAPAFPVAIDDPADCRRYVALVVEGVRNGPSPAALSRAVEAAGLRSVDLLVDLTQATMLETGQPLHAFDLRAVRDGVRVRRAREGERLATLEGVERALSPEDLVIADAHGAPLALAGVLGGRGSGVREDTTSILLESAWFDPVRVRRTATRHGVRTDASARFEKSLDPEGALPAARRFLASLLEHVPGARVVRAASDAYPNPFPAVVVDLDHGLVNARLGFAAAGSPLPDEVVRDRLRSVGFACEPRPGGSRVSVPSWRATKDVSLPEDLVEEVGRLHGYEHVTAAPPEVPMVPTRVPEARTLERDGRTVLSPGLGYAEIASYAFYGPKDCERTGIDPEAHALLANPLSADQDRMQTTCVGNLLRAAAKNVPLLPEGEALRLCEWTRIFPPTPGPRRAVAREVRVVGLLRSEARAGAASGGPGAGDAASRAFLGVLEDLRTLLDRLGVEGVAVEEAGDAALDPALPAPAWLHPGRRAVLRAGGDLVAVAGALHPAVARAHGLEATGVAVAEANLDRALARGRSDDRYEGVPRFPEVPFDVSLVVPRRTIASAVAAVIEGAAPGAVKDVALFDVYEGPGIPEGHRSLAFRMRFADRKGTLSPKAVERLQGRVLDVLRRAGWKVRTADSP
jgi:phenylalanyl-tRNA synthetase beta chain